MYVHNLDPVLYDFGLITIRWYSFAYILGILLGWWLGKKIIFLKFNDVGLKFDLKEFDNLITYLIFSIILGGRIGYILFYNFEYYLLNPLHIFKIWEGGMAFHGALIGVVCGTYLFSKKKNISLLFLLDIVACVSPIGIFFGRIANFINGELIGKKTDIFFGVIFPKVDSFLRHPSQLYEAFLEGLVLLIIMNLIILKKNYKIGTCSYIFLICYGLFRIFAEFFREPDIQIGYVLNLFSMGTMLSIIMVLVGGTLFFKKR